MNKKVIQIANYIVKSACENTSSGSWIIYPDDISVKFNISEDEYISLIGYVIEELQTRKEILDLVDVGDGTLDLGLALNYCPNYEWREGDEIIFDCTEAEFEKRIILPVAQPLLPM